MAVKGGAGGGERNFISPVAVQESKLPAFFYRLSPIAQRRYLRSDSIDRYELEMTPAIGAAVSDLLARLGTNQPKTVTLGAQAVVTELCRQLRVTPPIVEVRGVRPHSSSRELHGIFYPDARPPRMVVWMRTARRHHLVRAPTFVPTLAHEL